MVPLGFKKIMWIAMTVVMLLVSMEAQATPIVTAWNTRDLSGDRNFGHHTFALPWGFATPEIDDIVSQPITVVGLTDSEHATALIYNNVPTTYTPGYYLDLVITTKAGLKFDPGYIRVASSKTISPHQQFELRTSIDNFASVVDTSAFNNSTTRNGGSYTDIEADLSSLPDITGTTTFRLFFKDSDGSISAAGSTATWPYGFRIYGDSLAVPEPATLILLSLGVAMLPRRRMRPA